MATQNYNNQVALCDKEQREKEALEKRIAENVAAVAEDKANIKSNLHQIKVLKKVRCTQVNRYVDSIIDYRDAALLYGVLKKALKNFKPASFAELQNMKNVGDSMSDFIHSYAKEHISEFTQIMSTIDKAIDEKVVNYAAEAKFHAKRVKTARDIGTKWVDNKRGGIKLNKLSDETTKSLGSVKADLLALIDKLQAQNVKDHEEAGAHEAKENSEAATLKSRLEDDSRALQRDIERRERLLAALRAALAAKIAQLKKCREVQA